MWGNRILGALGRIDGLEQCLTSSCWLFGCYSEGPNVGEDEAECRS